MPRSSSACRSSRSDCSRGWCAASSTARRGARSRSLRSTSLLARTVWRRAGERLRLLAESFLALGVVFATLAIPLALEGRWTSAAWALEGAAIVWVGVRQQRLAARLFGLALQFLAGLAFLADPSRVTGALPLANTFYLACLFLALGGLFCAWYLDRHRAAVTRGERIVAHVLFGWGILWWVVGGLHEIDRHVGYPYRTQASLLFFTGSCVAVQLAARATRLAGRTPRRTRPAPADGHPRGGCGGRLSASVCAHRVDRVAGRVRRAPPRPAASRDSGEPLSILAARRGPLALRRPRELGGRLGDRRARTRQGGVAAHRLVGRSRGVASAPRAARARVSAGRSRRIAMPISSPAAPR